MKNQSPSQLTTENQQLITEFIKHNCRDLYNFLKTTTDDDDLPLRLANAFKTP